jgi:hypothetical protein
MWGEKLFSRFSKDKIQQQDLVEVDVPEYNLTGDKVIGTKKVKVSKEEAAGMKGDSAGAAESAAQSKIAPDLSESSERRVQQPISNKKIKENRWEKKAKRKEQRQEAKNNQETSAEEQQKIETSPNPEPAPAAAPEAKPEPEMTPEQREKLADQTVGDIADRALEEAISRTDVTTQQKLELTKPRVREEIREEVKRASAFKHRAIDAALGFATGFAGSAALRTAVSWAARKVIKRTLDLSAPGAGAIVGGAVAGGWEGLKEYKKIRKERKDTQGLKGIERFEELIKITNKEEREQLDATDKEILDKWEKLETEKKKRIGKAVLYGAVVGALGGAAGGALAEALGWGGTPGSDKLHELQENIKHWRSAFSGWGQPIKDFAAQNLDVKTEMHNTVWQTAKEVLKDRGIAKPTNEMINELTRRITDINNIEITGDHLSKAAEAVRQHLAEGIKDIAMQQGHALHHLEQTNDIIAKFGGKVYDTVVRVPENLPGAGMPPYVEMQPVNRTMEYIVGIMGAAATGGAGIWTLRKMVLREPKKSKTESTQPESAAGGPVTAASETLREPPSSETGNASSGFETAPASTAEETTTSREQDLDYWVGQTKDSYYKWNSLVFSAELAVNENRWDSAIDNLTKSVEAKKEFTGIFNNQENQPVKSELERIFSPAILELDQKMGLLGARIRDNQDTIVVPPAAKINTVEPNEFELDLQHKRAGEAEKLADKFGELAGPLNIYLQKPAPEVADNIVALWPTKGQYSQEPEVKEYLDRIYESNNIAYFDQLEGHDDLINQVRRKLGMPIESSEEGEEPAPPIEGGEQLEQENESDLEMPDKIAQAKASINDRFFEVADKLVELQNGNDPEAGGQLVTLWPKVDEFISDSRTAQALAEHYNKQAGFYLDQLENEGFKEVAQEIREKIGSGIIGSGSAEVAPESITKTEELIDTDAAGDETEAETKKKERAPWKQKLIDQAREKGIKLKVDLNKWVLLMQPEQQGGPLWKAVGKGITKEQAQQIQENLLKVSDYGKIADPAPLQEIFEILKGAKRNNQIKSLLGALDKLNPGVSAIRKEIMEK